MDLLRLACMAAWAIVALSVLPSAYRAIRQRACENDPFRAAFAFVGLLLMGFNLRWLIAPEDVAVWLALHGISLLLALYVFRVCRAHGPGRRG